MMMKKIAALTVATSLILGAFGLAALADDATTTTPQSVITVPGESAATTSTTENEVTTEATTEETAGETTTETTTEETTTEETTTEGTATETEEETEAPEPTMWVTKLNIPVDSPFYPILRVLEKLQLALTRSEELRAKLNAELAAKRIAEAQYLAAKAKLDDTKDQVTTEVEKLTEETAKLMEEAEQRLTEAQNLAEENQDEVDQEQAEQPDVDKDEDGDDHGKSECKKLIKAVNQHRIEVLIHVYLKVPATAKPAIMKNLIKFGATEEQLKKLTEALEKRVEKLDEGVQQAEQANLAELKATVETVKATSQVQDEKKIEAKKQLPPGQAKKLDAKQDKGKDKDKENNKWNDGKASSKSSGKLWR